MLRRIWDYIAAPFVAVAVLIDESRRQNLYGDWDGYWERRNKRRASRRRDG